VAGAQQRGGPAGEADPAVPGEAPDAWADAALVAAMLAVDPAGLGGVRVRAAAGPVRDRWLALLRAWLPPGVPWRRLPQHIRDERLLGGLDLAATLQTGRPVAMRGLLAEADGGVVVVPMAERMSPGTAARVASAMDRGEVAVEREGLALAHRSRFGVVALDEAVHDDEVLPAAVADRLALRVDLDAVRPRDVAGIDGAPDDGLADAARDVAAARTRLPAVTLPDEALKALAATSVVLGVGSLRPLLQAAQAARVHAALAGREVAGAEDAAAAARLVLAPRATRLPTADAAEPPPDAAEPPPPPPPETPDDAPPADAEPPSQPQGPIDDLVLAAALAALPPGLLARLRAEQAARDRAMGAGKSGALQKSASRGRPAGVRRGEPRGGLRLNLLETLRAAAPWQRLRRRGDAARRVEVRAEDFHVTHHRQRRETTTIFAVDASGSAALARLAEAKGAVELLLADCYVRRDSVAVIAFRGRGAELLLPPTRSLVRAKRALAGLPGGGGTPLAAAIDAAATLADAVRRRGATPVVVLLTDGRANVALDGTGGRGRAEADAHAAAARLRSLGCAVLVIDTSPQPQPQGRSLAAAMAATYLPLPYAGASQLSQVMKAGAGLR
jgi:magnesium chelatase subunit D